MFRVSYIDNKTDKIKLKSGFNQVSEAMKWVNKQKELNNITPLKLLVYNDYIDACSTICDL